MRFHIGFVINPAAGLGGSVALKGSDGAAIVREAIQRGAAPRAQERAARALEALRAHTQRVKWYTWGGAMGHDLLVSLGFDCTALGEATHAATSATDTRAAVASMAGKGVDLLLFVGGDGTARDVFDALTRAQMFNGSVTEQSEPPATAVLGIPAGVKMHSSVFAVSPSAAGELLVELATGTPVALQAAEVRDIDEQALREGTIRARYYGELLVPDAEQGMQRVKQSGGDVETLVVDEMAEYIVDEMDPATTYLVGPGTTTRAIMERLALPCALLGVDVLRDGQLLCSDAGEAQILAELAQCGDAPVCLIVTPTGGQGSLLGRGNQQISPRVLRRIGRDNLLIVATARKIAELRGRPLLLDTGDRELDVAMSGYRGIVTGYRQRILYAVAAA